MPAPIVLKIGGALVADADALAPLWQAVEKLREEAPVVLVHGGGPQATALAHRLGHRPRLVAGRRVTTDLDLEIIQWTLRGEVNAALVGQAQAEGLPAVGVSGADAGLVRVTRRPPWQVDGETVDFGHVGDVEAVHPALLLTLLDGGFLPVVATLGIDADGRRYNVNGDTVAAALAQALGAARFLLVTATGGVRRAPDDPASRLDALDADAFAGGVRDGWIQGGMRVKLETGFAARRAGIPHVAVVAPHDLAAGTRLL